MDGPTAGGIDNLKALAKRLSESPIPGGKAAQKAPIVMVPGFAGWGSPLFGSVNYWGGIENIPEQLAKIGYTVIVTPLAPFSSNWERACEIYAQLTSGKFSWYDMNTGAFEDDPEGINVDYGGVFPKQHGYAQYTQKRKTAVIFTQDPAFRDSKSWVWRRGNPVHFICHSQGGNTVRYLLHLMERGSFGFSDTSQDPAHSVYFNKPGRSNWAISVSTIGTPHRGTTVVEALQEYFQVVTIEEKTQLLGRLFTTMSFSDPDRRFYDLQLDHWGIKRLEKGAGVLETFAEMRARLESLIFDDQPGPVRRWLESNHNGLYDNGIAGVNELNNRTIPVADELYYFSFSFSCVKPFPDHWPSWTLDALQTFPLSVSRFLEELPIITDLGKLLRPILEKFPVIGSHLIALPHLFAQLVEEITKTIVGTAMKMGGWRIISTLVPFRQVVTWAFDDVVNRFLKQIGYAVKIPSKPSFLPIPSVFPIMIPTAYAMGCYELNQSQIEILGEASQDWKVCDGIVNTSSMKGPLRLEGDTRREELVVDVAQFPRNAEDILGIRGKYWHFGVTTNVDHADEIGVFIEEPTGRLTMDMYSSLAAIVTRLPREE